MLCGEVIPVPKLSKGGDESDGVYLTTFVNNKHTGGSEYHVYDGTTMDSTPVVILSVEKRVPFGFHAEWVSEGQLQAHLAAAHGATGV